MTSPSAPAPPPFLDVLVVGGGPVGGLAACVLGQLGLDVAVVDAGDLDAATRPGTDARAIAVALSAQRVLAAAGVWPGLDGHAGAILQIRVTDGASPLFLHYDHDQVGDDPFGWIIELPHIRRAVLERMRALPSVRLFPRTRIASLERGAQAATATLSDGRVLKARLVVAADGRGSATRREAGIGITRWDYHQSGIVVAVEHDRPHQGIAHEHFLPAGPFAILPMTGNRSGIVWTERIDLAPAIVAQEDASFLGELRSRMGDFLGGIRLASPRYHHPLSLQFAERTIDRRLALVGDAAHGMHPIAGQGMNMGIRDVAALAEVVAEAARLGLDPGGPDVLARYQRWRRFDNLLMLGMTDALNRLFSNDLRPVKLARDLGLGVVEKLPGLKRVFMKHAMGVVGDLPRLMRGEGL